MHIQDIITSLEQVAPRHLQESYDNAGLIVGEPGTPCSGVMCSLDATEEVIRDAHAHGCNLVVSHHPVIFHGLKNVSRQTVTGRAVYAAIECGIALYACHTNLDNVLHQGVNQRIAERIGLKEVQILQPLPRGADTGAGVIGTLSLPMPAAEFLSFLKGRMQSGCIRYTGYQDHVIAKVAVCGGSGSFLITRAAAAGADAFVTADVKYHDFFLDNPTMLLADIGHYESEQFTITLLAEIISQQFPNFAVLSTQVNTNPINYL
jgi:dinuclear metal center YbgI/SA1388 family protein